MHAELGAAHYEMKSFVRGSEMLMMRVTTTVAVEGPQE